MCSVQARLKVFYSKYDPILNNTNHLQTVSDFFDGSDTLLFEALYMKYVAPAYARRKAALAIQNMWRQKNWVTITLTDQDFKII